MRAALAEVAVRLLAPINSLGRINVVPLLTRINAQPRSQYRLV